MADASFLDTSGPDGWLRESKYQPTSPIRSSGASSSLREELRGR